MACLSERVPFYSKGGPGERIIMSEYTGLMAAVLTAGCWAFSSLFFALAGRKAGSPTVNHVRLWIALAINGVIHLGLFGTILPQHVETERWLYLGASGIVGYVIGDAMLFEGFVRIGPQQSMLIMTASPVMGAFMAWIFLGEVLYPLDFLGIAVTLTGIGLVILERRNGSAGGPSNGGARVGLSREVTGILLAFGGALGQAGGLLLSKFGLAGGFSPLSANMIRVTTGTGGIFLLYLCAGQIPEHARRLRDGAAAFQAGLGALMGPVIGVTFSLIAIQRVEIGVATTLMQLAPVLLLPISHFVLKEKITPRAWFGTLVAVGGAALLFLGR